MLEIYSYDSLGESVRTEIILKPLTTDGSGEKIHLTSNFIKGMNLDYSSKVYQIKGYYPNNDYEETKEGIKLAKWAGLVNRNDFNNSTSSIRKIEIRIVKAGQVEREIKFEGCALSYKEEYIGVEHYFYLTLREVEEMPYYNNLIFPKSEKILQITFKAYKENKGLDFVFKKLGESYNLSEYKESSHILLNNNIKKKAMRRQKDLHINYWVMELWISALSKNLEKVSFRLNVYLSKEGYEILLNYKKPLMELKRLIGAVGSYIAEKILSKERVELKKSELSSIMYLYSKDLREVVEQENIKFKISRILGEEKVKKSGSSGSLVVSMKAKEDDRRIVNEEENYGPIREEFKEEELKKEEEKIIGINYLYQDGSAVESAYYKILDKNGELFQEGKLDKNGKILIEGKIPEGELEAHLGEDERKYKPEIKPEVNPNYNPRASIEEILTKEESIKEDSWYEEIYNKTLKGLKEAGNWSKGVLLGDFEENPTTGQIIARMLLTMIPVIDQIGDIEDIVANILHLCDESEENDQQAWLGLILTTVGMIPVAGSALKGIFKIILKETGEAALKGMLKLLRKMGKGDPIKFLEKLDWEKLRKSSTKNLQKVFDSSIDGFKKIKEKIPGIGKFKELIETLEDIINRLEKLKVQINRRVKEFFEEMQDKLSEILSNKELVEANTGIRVKVKAVPKSSYKEIEDIREIKKTEVREGNVIAKTEESELERKSLEERAVKNADEVLKIEGRFTRKYVKGLKSSEEIIKKRVLKLGKDMKYFKKLLLKQGDELSESEAKFIKEVRDSISSPTEDTLLQKVMPIEKLDDIFNYTTIRGCTAKAGDVQDLKTIEEIYDGLRLDYEGSLFTEADKCVAIRYKVEEPEYLTVPYSKKIDINTKKMDNIDSPQTGHGFIKNDRCIPEYESWIKGKPEGLMPTEGEVYIVSKDGSEELIGEFNSKKEIWKKLK
ncbi:hypothetical protein [Haliovirga abyssi]|uniref:Uncharacterized protein n=1 Tax=Haliovirga abyssi TaxID=2996794 RepID=A0AAU9DB58_9FUSO|nr:hypothetical protein [Haliovirga abyssi]BDU50706.1 hypothetical protein HLVA_12750 [Haliovirga abyssi]